MKKLLLVLLGFLMTIGMAFAAVDINSADEKGLDAIKGVGPVRAKAIIDDSGPPQNLHRVCQSNRGKDQQEPAPLFYRKSRHASETARRRGRHQLESWVARPPENVCCNIRAAGAPAVLGLTRGRSRVRSYLGPTVRGH